MLLNEEEAFKIVSQDEFEIFVKKIPKAAYNTFQFKHITQKLPKILHDSPFLLHVAAFYGSMQCLNYMLSHDVDITKQDNLYRDVSHFAVTGGHIYAIKVLADKKVDFSRSLILAAGLGDLDVFKFLLNQLKISPTVTDSFGSTILHGSSIGGTQSVIDYIISLKKVDINTQDNQGNTPLHIAVSHGNIYMIQTLLKIPGIKLNIKNSNGQTPLHIAATKNTSEIISMLVSKIYSDSELQRAPSWDFMTLDLYRIDSIEEINCPHEESDEEQQNSLESIINSTDNEGNTAYLLAVQNGYKDVVSYFLRIQCNDERAVNQEGMNALHISVSNSNKKIVNLILEQDSYPSVNQKDKKGKTPLIYSCELNDGGEIASLLFNVPTLDPKITDNEGKTALHIACEAGNVFVFESLLRILSPNVKNQALTKLDRNGKTPIHRLLLCKDISKFKDFVERMSINFDYKDSLGKYAIFQCINDNKPEYLKIIAESGKCNINITDQRGWTPLHHAVKAGNLECVKSLLCSKDLNLNAKSDRGMTPLCLANDDAIRKILHEKGAI